MTDSEFPHLTLLHKFHGQAELEGSGLKPSRVQENEQNRSNHGRYLATQFESVRQLINVRREDRHLAGLPRISGGQSFLLQIPDEDDEVLEWLSVKLGLEFVAEYDDGYVIVATGEIDLDQVVELANQFIGAEHGSGKMASVLEVYPDSADRRRIERVLDSQVLSYWPFVDDRPYLLDISVEVAPQKKPRATPIQNRNWKPETNERKRREHKRDVENYWEKYDDLCLDRGAEVEALVAHYGGSIIGSFQDSGLVKLPDSFSMRIEMDGRGFTDLITNFPSIFEVTIPDEVEQPFESPLARLSEAPEFVLLSPTDDSPSICIIDSGIQEEHRWLEASIAKDSSFCFIPSEDPADVADYVSNGGHGTRVASACLYPQYVPNSGQMKAPFWLLNARVLDRSCKLSKSLFPPDLLASIVDRYKKRTGVYQHSIAANTPCRISRMSAWSASIDYLSHHEDVLFIQATGNLTDRGGQFNPGIVDHLANGRTHPFYLIEGSSRIANPAQSLQALTVGSISGGFYNDGFKKSVADSEHPSSFSRSGFGLWKSIKPEVVEFGGDFVKDSGNPPSISRVADVCPELARGTLNGGPAVARDSIGTSFSAPKIAHIAGKLAGQLPGRSPLLYRALIANSARWPAWAENGSGDVKVLALKTIGYGVPSVERATRNDSSRVCLILDEERKIRAGEGMVFGVPIPQSLRSPGQDFPVRIDVTLSYSAEPRRTRKSRRGYLGVWLDWKSSKRGESFAAFQNRAVKDFNDESVDNSGDSMHWTIGRQSNFGVLKEGSRSNGTLQKDWTVIRSYELPDTFGIVVRGHKGWDRKNSEAKARFSLVVSFEVLGEEIRIYEEVLTAIEAELAVQTTTQVGISV